MNAPLPPNEAERLKALREYQVLDTETEAAFDDLTRLAAEICDTPIALVSLVDTCRQWFKSRFGLEATETPRDLAFCAYTILKPEVLIVPDTLEDERFANNALVTSDPHIRFYAGTPLITQEGYSLGSLCVIDRVPRQLSEEQIESLKVLGRQVVAQLELRYKVNQLETSIQERDRAQNELDNFFNLSLDLLCVVDKEGYFRRLNPAFEAILGYSREELQSQPLINFQHPGDKERSREEIEKLFQGDMTIDLENRYRTKDGSYKWFSWRATCSKEDGLIYAIGREITQRKKAEQERLELLQREQAARNQVTTILESITDAFFALDADWRFNYINQQAEVLLQRSRSELLGKTIWDEFPEAEGLKFHEHYSRAMTKRVSVEFEEYYPPLKSWFSVHAYPSENSGIAVYFENINERKQAEEELRSSEQRYRLLFENNPHPMWVFDRETLAFLAVNTAAIRHYGYSQEEFLSMTILDIRPPEDVDELLENLKQNFCTLHQPGVWRHQKKDGTTIFVEISCQVIPFKDKQAQVVIASDITERLQAENALRETTTLQRAILNSANYSIISTTVDGTIMTFNAAAQKWLGYTAAEVVGKATPELIHDSQEVQQRAKELSAELGTPISPGFETFVAKTCSGKTDEREWHYIRKDGTRFPVSLSITALQDPESGITGYLGIASDITERKRTQNLLTRRMRQQAGVAKLGQIALSQKDVQSLMNKAVQFVAQGLNVEYAKVLEFWNDDQTLLLKAGVGWKKNRVGKVLLKAQDHSHVTYTLMTSQPLIIEDLRTDSRFNKLPLLEEHNVISGISVVIQGQNRVFGTLGAHTAKQRKFTKDDINFLQTIANLLATAIERHQIEEALRESEERWQLALRGNNDGIWDWNLKTNEVFFSIRWKEMLGYRDSEIPNQIDEWSKRVHPDDLDWVLKVVQDHLEKKTPFYISEYRLQCKDGSYKWILDRGQALWDKEGNVVRMAGSHTDITERKEAESTLKRETLRSRLFAEISLKIRQSLHTEEILQTAVTEVQAILQTDRVVIFKIFPDGSGKIMQEAVVSDAFSILGQQIADPCFSSEYMEKYRQGRVRAIENIQESDIHPCHLELLEDLKVKANLVVPIIQQDRLWGLLIAHSCVETRQWTEFEADLLKQLADQMGIALAQGQLLEQETQQRLELARSNSELQQFAYVASHDLQEPLRKIQAFGDRLVAKYDTELDERGKDYLMRMQSAASRMQILINDLLSLSRVTTKAQPFVLTNFNIIVQEVLSDLEIRLQQTQGQVQVEKLPTLEADPVQIRQLFQNLISNALKFHKPNEPPIISISSHLIQNPSSHPSAFSGYRITVEDAGIGFEEKYRDRIFQAFQRLHGRSQYEGTGIGLAICRKIVERHGGLITAESSPVGGSKFIIMLPMQQSKHEKV